VALATAVLGSAASLGGVGASGLGAGQAVVTSCDDDGVDVAYTTSAGIVQSVTVTGVAAGCNGGALRLVLANGSGASIGAGGPETVTAASVTVPLSPQPSAAAVAGVHISIIGPST
jgi:hypothetical protein